jgi:5-methylcytosine-specific restriction enzyme B
MEGSNVLAITKQEIEEALNDIDRDGIPKKNRSTGYCLLTRDKHYPPKHVLRLVYRKKGVGFTLGGGEPTNSKLRAQGYLIERHKCRNPNFKIIDQAIL